MIPLYKPYMPASLPEMEKLLHSGALAFGKFGKEFENGLKSYFRNERVTVVNSYTSAVLVALICAGLKYGDEVIASPMACLASTQPLAVLGIKLVWSDIDPDRGTLDPDCVRKLISSRTRAIIHNHYCGFPGYVDEINSIGREYGVLVIDDCIEAFGSEYRNTLIGNTGADITVYSFQAVRLPNTLDGGAIIFRDDKLYEKSIMVRDSGIDRRYFRDSEGEISAKCDITIPGLGATMNEMSSYIGLVSLADTKTLLEQQKRNGESWQRWFGNSRPEIRLLDMCSDISPNYWVYGILSENKAEAIREFRKLGFYASGVHLPNNFYSIFGDTRQLPGVDEFHSRFIALPCGWWTEIDKALDV